MGDNNTDSAWYAKVPLKDWAIIVGIIAHFLNSSANLAKLNEAYITLSKSIDSINLTLKENEKAGLLNHSAQDKRVTALEYEIKNIKIDLERCLNTH